MKRGDIWVARLNPDKGSEVGKSRPVIVMQADAVLVSGLATVIVVPLTTQHRPAFGPMRIRITARDRLLKDCYAMVEQPRAIDRARFAEGPLTALTVEEMAAVEKSIRVVMGMW